MRGEMEARFGHDFSRVRVHTDGHAAESARAANAKAFTVGSDVVFGEGRYAPETHDGSRLLAHELAHTVQQRGAGTKAAPIARVDRSRLRLLLQAAPLRADAP